MKRSLVLVASVLLAVSPVWAQMDGASAAASARAAGVSPGGSAGFALSAACPTFSWTSIAGAEGYELRAYRLEARGELEPVSALAVELPAGASSWTPPADGCLAPGERYAWSVRAQIAGGLTAWSEALLFEIAAAPTAAELQAALEVVQRYLGTARVGEPMVGRAEADIVPTRAVAATESPESQAEGKAPREAPAGGGPATAVRGEVPDAVGETYGVRGLSNSPDGAGVRADNNAAGPDLVLGGSPVAELTETGFSRDSASPLTFDFSNPGAGTMTLEVDGNSVFHSGNDGTGSGLDADLLDGQDSTAFAGGVHTHSGEDITSGTVAEPRIDALLSRDAEVLPTVLAGDGAGSTLDADLLDGLNSTAFLGSGTDDWVDETGDTMTGTLTLSAGDVALHTAATVTKGGSRFLWDDGGNGSFGVGRGALASNTTGSSNTAVGTFALDANTSGVFNVALGRDALGANTTAWNNTAVGAFALDANTIGTNNVALGTSALGANTTGSGNTALGYAAGLNVTTTGNNIFIDNYGVAGDSNRIRIGDTQTETFIAGINGNTTAGGVAVFVNSLGELGISISSRRFKEDIADVGGVSERLLALRPVSFRYTKEAAGEGERPVEYGLLAEEVAEVFPELVAYDEGGEPWTVRYHLLVPLLLNELQREHVRARRLEEELAGLSARLEAVERARSGANTVEYIGTR
jgi:hypothetical protein